MKRYTHAWIALHAIDRLGKLAAGILQNGERVANERKLKASKETDPGKKEKIEEEIAEDLRIETDKYDSIKNLQALLRDPEKIKLVVQGTWIPDNVIADNREGHIWKYEPPLLKGESRRFRKDHAKTESLCYEEAQNTYAWNKPWRKLSGFLADRCEAVHQTVRDMFLFQENEMYKLAATIIIRFGDDFLSKQNDVKTFLSDPDAVKKFYDNKGRKAVVDFRNLIGKNESVDNRIRDCIQLYRTEIKNQITKSNCANFSNGQSSFFPMYFTDDQIILMLFTLSHYLSDAHMPLHADSREFSGKECGDVHGAVEEEWEKWIISKANQTNLKDMLSETERAQKFIDINFDEKDPNWGNFQYPNKSLLKKFDEELGKAIWEDREIELYQSSSLWGEAVGITYASYCLASRLLAFNDKTRTVPKGSKEKYCQDFENVAEVSKKDWSKAIDSQRNVRPSDKSPIRRQIYDFALAQGGENVDFNYLSLLLLVDSVDCVAKVWGKIVKDHLDVTCNRK